MPSPLNHGSTQKPDNKLEEEAAAHLAGSPALQLVTELFTRLRDLAFPWWTPDHLRAAHSANERMKWFAARPDIRQRITTQLTGLAPKAARNKTPEFQADLIDSVIDSGDITVDTFERAFEPSDIAVYGPAGEIWKLFRRRMPWDDDRTGHQDVIGWFLGALLADKSTLDGKPRTPVLTALAVRTAIDGRVWHSRIPLDVRVEIDAARFRQLKEKPNEPFTAAQDLLVATPALIAASVPLKELTAVMDLAGVALGFETAGAASAGASTTTAASTAASPATAPTAAKTASIPPASPSPTTGSVRPVGISPRASTPPPGTLSKENSKEMSLKELAKDLIGKDSKDGAPKTGSIPPAAPATASKPPPAKADATSKADKSDGSAKPDRSFKIEDPPTSDEKSGFDEFESTNPWAVPSGLPEPGADPSKPKSEKKRD
jgi:hypothetical protein